MSFHRTESPPPRIPSPLPLLIPLPSPPLLNRIRPSPQPPLLHKSRLTTRSCDALRHRSCADRADFTAPSLPPTPTRRIGEPIMKRGHRRSPSTSPRYSPPPSPAISTPPPPVPPIPPFTLGPTDRKPVLHPQPNRPVRVFIPELDAPSPHTKPRSPSSRHTKLPSRPDGGMTCLQFFSMRNSSHIQRGPGVAV